MPEGASWASQMEVNSGRHDLAVFLLEGMIQGGETLALEEAVGKLPTSKSVAVILNSPGGNLQEGMKLGRFFYQARIMTSVLGYGGGCHSACAIAFLGGRDREGRPSRTKMTDGNLGFHQFRRTRNAAESTKKYTKADMERELPIDACRCTCHRRISVGYRRGHVVPSLDVESAGSGDHSSQQ